VNHWLTAAETARRIAAGELTAVAALEAYLPRIATLDRQLGAYLAVDAEGARAQAAEIDRKRAAGESLGPLAGVPVALKDVLVTRGMATTAASKILAGWIPPYDGSVVERLRAAGAVIVGKLNCDEFAMGSSTERSAYKPTQNPWDVTRVPGGSSGGSSAAVAAGLCAASLGTDTGGSIRQPAAFCGVVGIKPTYGRVSRWGVVAFASSLDQVGPLTRTVGDAALMLDVISGFDPRDSTSLDLPVPAHRAALTGEVKGLRVGMPSEYFAGEIDGEVRIAVERAAGALRERGAELVEISLPHSALALPVYYIVAPAEASSNLARYDGVRYGLRVPGRSIGELYDNTRAEGFGDEVRRRVMIGTYVLSAGYYDAYYLRAQKVRTLIKKDFEDCFAKGVSAILTPATPSAAFGVGEKGGADPVEMYLNDIFTVTVNMAGLPGIAVPAGKDVQGLPLGLQLIGRPFDEETLFSLGEVLEQAAGRFTPPKWW